MDAIIYTSNSGTTGQYAKLLGERLGVTVCSLKDSHLLPKNSEIIYLGWIMAGSVKGYKKAAARFRIKAVCGVGMGRCGSQTTEIRKNNSIPDEVGVFTLQGGFDISKLHGVYKLMMLMMKNTAGKALADKKDRTDEENDMLDLMLNGGSRVKAENLDVLVKYLESNEGDKEK